MTEAPSFLPPYWDPNAQSPRFKMGARVRVRTGAPFGHVRTPWYVRGATGVVERICGHFPNPQELAYRRFDARKLPLYRIRFALEDLWPNESGYDRRDTIDVEIFEPWLEPFWDYAGDFDAQAKRLEAERDAR